MISRLLTIHDIRSFFLFGPRQSGKTTLIENIIDRQKTLSINLFLTSEYTRLIAEPVAFERELDAAIKNQRITTIFIDEIQRIPELLNTIHVYLEQNKNIQFILAGSSARKLKRMNANMLAGRALTCKLYPFCVSELKENLSSLKELLEFGLIPTVYLNNDKAEKRDILRSYIETFIKEEIELEAKIRKLDSFIRFLQVAGNENGNILNFSNIGRDVGTNYNTVKDYFQILEDCLIGFFLYPFSRSMRKRFSKHPKFYFFDCGVVRALTKRLNVELTSLDPDYGRLFEHFVILEIVKLNSYLKLDLELSYYRTDSGIEVDLIIETPARKLIALEIKSTGEPKPTHVTSLNAFKKDYPEAQCYLIANTPRPQILEGIDVIPWNMIHELIFS